MFCEPNHTFSQNKQILHENITCNKLWNYDTNSKQNKKMSRLNIYRSGSRWYSSTRRKYPIDREQEKNLPTFEYKTSKKDYQRVFSWGNIQTGALGVPYITKDVPAEKVKFIKSPKRLSIGEKHVVTSATCGFGFTLFAVKSDTDCKVYGTGLNTDSQIGYHVRHGGKPMEILYYPQPIPLKFQDASKTKVLKVSAGRAHSAILTNEGLFLLGNNSYGQCGRKIVPDENYIFSNYINHIPSLEDKPIKDVVCGQDHTLALTEDGSVYSCGWGADGQTGVGTYKNIEEFTKVKGDIQDEKITHLACRSDFVLAINDNGELFGWGNTEYSQMVTATNEQQVSNPTYLNFTSITGKVKHAATGGTFCLVTNEEGQVYTWGYGILGAGPNVTQKSTPILLPETLFGRNYFQPDNRVVKVLSGLSCSGAITNKGDLFMWGRNLKCCLGMGHEKDQYFPFKISLGGYVKSASCGVDHVVAVCDPYV